MEFSPPRPRQPVRENIVPMINVVFLLLIFFLMTAQITAPVPFDVTPPTSDSRAMAEGQTVLHVAADGTLYFAGLEGDAVWAGLADLGPDAPLLIRADERARAADLARLLTRLGSLGLTDIALVTEAPR